jgi:hypothetical protein
MLDILLPYLSVRNFLFLVSGAALLAAAWCVMSDRALRGLVGSAAGRSLTPRQLLTARKVGYVVLVLGLFTYCLLWRHAVVNVQVADKPLLREHTQGDVHLSGAMVRLGLGGLRGLATCYLWQVAQEKQKRNQLNELEVVVGWLTELQPHFNTPWVFQSWNLAYNVSNKTDRVFDKYFYISRGLRLLADGERQNHHDPDLRYEMGSTIQHKINQSDETNIHRSLFQLSLIPPHERDPARFWVKSGTTRTLNVPQFQDFCEKHPQLVRRLREGMHRVSALEQGRQFTCATPEDVVQFLADNYRVPSLYQASAPTPPDVSWDPKIPYEKPDDDPLERFPLMPPPHDNPWKLFDDPPSDQRAIERNDESAFRESSQLDEWDAYVVARAWYSYSQEAAPVSDVWPGSWVEIKEEDRAKLRRPRHMIILLFRHYPPRAQSYIATRLQEEGWFDGQGWTVGGWGLEGDDGKAFVVGEGRDWSADAWELAYLMWKAHGERNHLLLSKAEEENLIAQAARYWKKEGLPPGSPPRYSETFDDPESKDAWNAAKFMMESASARRVSNYPHHFYQAEVERDPRMVAARKVLFQAEQKAQKGFYPEAVQIYTDKVIKGKNGQVGALDAWRELLKEHPEFRRDENTIEETHTFQDDYLFALNKSLPTEAVKSAGAAAVLAGSSLGGLPMGGLAEALLAKKLPSDLASVGPFDDEMDEVEVNGSKVQKPWIRQDVMKHVKEQRKRFSPRRRDAPDQPPNPEAPKPAGP